MASHFDLACLHLDSLRILEITFSKRKSVHGEYLHSRMKKYYLLYLLPTFEWQFQTIGLTQLHRKIDCQSLLIDEVSASFSGSHG